MTSEKIILWGIKASPYVRKIMIALAEKNLAYEHREILPASILKLRGEVIPEDFERASPLGKIPAVQIDDFCIADSAVISAYLDRQFPMGSALYPSNAQDYAKALWFESYADNTFSDITYHKIFMENVIKPKLLKKDTNVVLVEQAIQYELPPLLDYLQQSILKTQWLAGEHFSMADVAVAVQLLALNTAGINLKEKGWLALNNYLNNVLERPSFRKCLAN